MSKINLKYCFILLLVFFIFFLLTFIYFSKSWSSNILLPISSTITPTTNNIQIESMTLEKIFIDNHSFISTLSSELITLIATGDVIPARSVNYQTIIRKDFKWPFANTAEFIKNTDITFINLESPLTDKCPITQSGMIFCGDKKHIEGLLYAGIDVVNLANNHLGNQGIKGINETLELLNNSEILTAGINDTVVKEIKGVKFAFLGFNDIEKSGNPSPAEDVIIMSQIKNARKISDIIIVAFHWGDEYTPQPNIRQRYLAHLAIDIGADLIIGNHPHWIQPVEIYKGKLIVYAHGNFIFDQMWSEKTKEGVVGKYTFYNKKLIDVQFFPIRIRDFGQPYFLDGLAKENILNEMLRQSLILRT
jgi:gamma-polyglutamate biosynthesis protein CapA